MTTPAGSTPKGPLTAAIAEDHQEMYEYYDAFTRARSAGDNDKAERWARQLIWEVARHAVGEEIVVYPLMEKHLGAQGLRLADQDRTEHQFVKDRLYKLDSARVDSEEYDALLKEIMEHLHQHNDSEETKDLPLLEPVIGSEGSQKAAESFKMTKKFVPTRPHPSAPDHPPLETFAGFLAAPLDKLKDAFAKFPTQEMKDEVKS
ncbi:hypothetical protein ACEPAI_1986 [Sanghuangporus weigelae]